MQQADERMNVLLLEDKHIFLGRGFGFCNKVRIVGGQLEITEASRLSGELCFNTGMSGYQEILSDPSYAGQIICFSFPHIGNVGTNAEDYESSTPHARAMLTREYPTNPSNWRSDTSLDQWLIRHKISGICGMDTRALIHHLRERGSMRAIVCTVEADLLDASTASGLRREAAELLYQHLFDSPKMQGQNLSQVVSRGQAEHYKAEQYKAEHCKAEHCKVEHDKAEPQHKWLPAQIQNSDKAPNKVKSKVKGKVQGQAGRDLHVAVLDLGVKENILQLLEHFAAQVTIFPLQSSWQDIAASCPDGLFLSNGPGDPAPVYQQIRGLLQQAFQVRLPIFGICLGHQLLALHLGGQTEHMHHGHRGINHPVWNLERNIVEVTSQNHGFCVASLPENLNLKVTHRSLFDSSIEGLRSLEYPMFSVQYHPEASPGPHDSMYLFEDFAELMEQHANVF